MEKRTKMALQEALGLKKIVVAMLFFMILLPFVSAWSTNTFNNSLTTEVINSSQYTAFQDIAWTNTSGWDSAPSYCVDELWNTGCYPTLGAGTGNIYENFTNLGYNYTWVIRMYGASADPVVSSCWNYTSGSWYSLVNTILTGTTFYYTTVPSGCLAGSVIQTNTQTISGIGQQVIYYDGEMRVNHGDVRYIAVPSSVDRITFSNISFNGNYSFNFTYQADSLTLDDQDYSGYWLGVSDTHLFTVKSGPSPVFEYYDLIAKSHLGAFSIAETVTSRYGVEANNTDVWIMADESGSGEEFISRYNYTGSLQYRFNLTANNANPSGMTVDTEGNIYVSDTADDLIYKYYGNGSIITNYSVGDGLVEIGYFSDRFFGIKALLGVIYVYNSTWSNIQNLSMPDTLDSPYGFSCNDIGYCYITEVEDAEREAFGFNVRSIPESFYIDVGIDGTNDYSYNSILNNPISITNLTSSINSYLRSCTPAGGYCYVPVTFKSTLFSLANYFDINFNNMGIFENSQTFNATTLESKNESFILNFTYDSDNFEIASVRLYYNNTNYGGSTLGTGSDLIALSNVIIPEVSTTTINSFYWEIGLLNSTGTYYYNSSSNNQTVTKGTSMSAGLNCGAGFYPAMNFSLYDEVNFTALNGDFNYYFTYGYSGNPNIYSVNGSVNNSNGFSLCLNASEEFYFIGYGEVQYEVDGYTPRRYYIFGNTRVTNSTIIIPLYDLESTLATSFLFTAQTTTLQPYVNYYVGLMRWYPQENTYKIVDMGKTDDKGQTVLRVKTEDVDYRLALYKNDGTLVKLLSPIRMICQTNPCSL